MTDDCREFLLAMENYADAAFADLKGLRPTIRERARYWLTWVIHPIGMTMLNIACWRMRRLLREAHG